MQSDFVTRIFGDMQAVVHGVGRARRDEVDIHNRPRGPGIALVDGIAVGVDL